MSGTMSLQRFTLLIKDLMMGEGIDEEHDITIKGQPEKGGNFMGEVTFITVVPKETDRVYNLVLKSINGCDSVRKSLPVESGFERECFMYRVVFPAMENFVKPVSDKVKVDYTPKFYSACNEYKNETLILENMFHQGYRVWNRQKVLDMEHVLLVIKTLAKHHAISLAFAKKAPKVFENIRRNMFDILVETAESTNQGEFFKSLVEKVCVLFEKMNKKDLAKKIDKEIKENVEKVLYEGASVEDRLVICHGDCWNTNILFKYEDQSHSHVSKVCLVDFQFSTMESPVRDLSFFLYTSCDKSQLDQLDFILQTYYTTFSSTCTSLGCVLNDFFTYEDLLRQWKKYSSFGLIMCTFFLRIEQLLRKEVPDMDMQNPFQKVFEEEIENEEIFNRRIIDVFTHYAEKFL